MASHSDARRAAAARASGSRPVKQEIRDNLVRKLQAGEPLFPGIIGYDDTVIPQLVNAILSRHNFILLGLRGQAKSRILRGLVDLLDEQIPVVPGCEIHDDPLAPICGACRARVATRRRPPADRLAAARRALRREARDAGRDDRRHGRRHRSDQGGAGRPQPRRRADDALRAAAARQPRHLRDQRAARSGRQDSGRPVQHPAGRRRPDQGLPDPAEARRACSSSPRTPRTTRRAARSSRRSRTASARRSARTIRPRGSNAIAITAQEAWTDAAGRPDGRDSGVTCAKSSRRSRSRRAPIARSTSAPASASGCRSPRSSSSSRTPSAARSRNGETIVVPRVTDLYAALPSITGKFELEYEGELRGAEQVARDLIRSAVGAVFTGMFDGVDTRTVVEWFDLGGSLPLSDVTLGRRRHRADARRAGAARARRARRRGAGARRAGRGVGDRLRARRACTRRRRSAAATSAATPPAPRRRRAAPRREEPRSTRRCGCRAAKKKYYN